MNFVMLAKHEVKVNQFVVILKNLYNRLEDLFASTKFGASKDNTEFRAPQAMDTLLQNCFLVDPTLSYQNQTRRMKVLLDQHRKLRLKAATKFRECIFGAHPLISTKTWKMSRKSMRQIHNQKLEGNWKSYPHFYRH